MKHLIARNVANVNSAPSATAFAATFVATFVPMKKAQPTALRLNQSSGIIVYR
jgi:hypothetical protein